MFCSNHQSLLFSSFLWEGGSHRLKWTGYVLTFVSAGAKACLKHSEPRPLATAVSSVGESAAGHTVVSSHLYHFCKSYSPNAPIPHRRRKTMSAEHWGKWGAKLSSDSSNAKVEVKGHFTGLELCLEVWKYFRLLGYSPGLDSCLVYFIHTQFNLNSYNSYVCSIFQNFLICYDLWGLSLVFQTLH